MEFIWLEKELQQPSWNDQILELITENERYIFSVRKILISLLDDSFKPKIIEITIFKNGKYKINFIRKDESKIMYIYTEDESTLECINEIINNKMDSSMDKTNNKRINEYENKTFIRLCRFKILTNFVNFNVSSNGIFWINCIVFWMIFEPLLL